MWTHLQWIPFQRDDSGLRRLVFQEPTTLFRAILNILVLMLWLTEHLIQRLQAMLCANCPAAWSWCRMKMGEGGVRNLTWWLFNRTENNREGKRWGLEAGDAVCLLSMLIRYLSKSKVGDNDAELYPRKLWAKCS